MPPESVVEVSSSFGGIGEVDEHVIAISLSPGAMPLLKNTAVSPPASGHIALPAAWILVITSSALLPIICVS